MSVFKSSEEDTNTIILEKVQSGLFCCILRLNLVRSRISNCSHWDETH